MTPLQDDVKAPREVTLVRIFDAPRALVFEVWTQPKHLEKWWGPHGFTTPLVVSDARAGGTIRIHMQGPDGTIYPMAGTYNEVIAPERVVYTSAVLGEDGQALFEIRNTAKFEDENGKTKLTIHAVVVKATSAAEQYLEGMEEGWSQSLERLAAYLPKA